MFGKNPKKADYRVRFQNRRFREQLNDQRNYKRSKKILPETAWGVFLSKIGLGSWLSRGITFVVFLLLIYLVFVPNVFFIDNIEVRGASAGELAGINNTIGDFLAKKNPLPQKNLLLLSKGSLESYIIKNNDSVWQVRAINKKLPSTLIVTVSPRLDAFQLKTDGSVFNLSNDGIITNELTATTATSSLATIKLGSEKDLVVDKKVFSQQEMDYFVQLQSQLPAVIKTPISYFSLDDLQTPDLWVYTDSDFKLAFDLKSDVSETLNRFKLLFSQISEQDVKRLYYLDMRFNDRGYICYRATTCALPPVQATTTPAIINP